MNCVAPGPVWTPLNPADQDAEKVAKYGGVDADEAAGPAGGDRAGVRLPRLAGGSSYITGEVLPVVGGPTRVG